MASWMVWLKRKLRNVTLRKFVYLFAFAVIVFNEFLVYTIQSFRWNRLPEIDPDDDMVILLVSDPQLIGIQDEMGFPVGMLARWDCDRYLRKTFSRAYSYSTPDIILFLGDIMDEGSKATADEYGSYYSRFHDIFYEIRNTKTIIVPGDNDIGGEAGDFRTPFKVNRFEKHFETLTGVVSHKFIDFLKLDIRQHYDEIPEKERLISSWASEMKNPIRMMVNHETMTPKLKSTIYPIVRLAKPNLMLSGHWHLSQMFTCGTCLSDNNDLHTWPYHLQSLENEKDFMDIDLTDAQALNELMVPTCSYRMGVRHMGYGVAVVNKQGSMKYTVLWLPSRYTVLRIYVMALVIIVLLLLVDYIFTPVKKRKSLFLY